MTSKKLSDPTSVRLPPDLHATLTQVAAREGTTLGELIRRLLEGHQPMLDGFETLRREVLAVATKSVAAATKAQSAGRADGISGGSAARATPALDAAMAIEILLLLRSIAGPQRLLEVHAEVERRALTVWNGDAA